MKRKISNCLCCCIRRKSLDDISNVFPVFLTLRPDYTHDNQVAVQHKSGAVRDVDAPGTQTYPYLSTSYHCHASGIMVLWSYPGRSLLRLSICLRNNKPMFALLEVAIRENTSKGKSLFHLRPER